MLPCSEGGCVSGLAGARIGGSWGFDYLYESLVGHIPSALPACLWGKTLFKLLVLSPYLVNSRPDSELNHTFGCPELSFCIFTAGLIPTAAVVRCPPAGVTLR